MTSILLFVVIALLIVAGIFLLLLVRNGSRFDASLLSARMDIFEKTQERTERTVREEVARSRDESGKAARDQRQELVAALKAFGDSIAQRMIEAASAQKEQLDHFSAQLNSFAQTNGERLDGARSEAAVGAKQLREEVVATLKSISGTMASTISDLGSAQRAQLEAFASRLDGFAKSSGERLDGVRAESATASKQLREEVVSTLKSMQEDNARHLDLMRQTVDEKLQGTLEKRLGESFKQVSERLEQVHKGLGEMQTLASGVGDLKKVLTNVKTRGTWGEVQLGALLDQVLNPDQYATNVATRDGGERVEFAVRLPGRSGDKADVVWLPVDAKFPVEDYQRLVEAQERADPDGVETAGKQLESRVKDCAWDISGKYLNPPMTTDFGILFLPVEGLYAEVIRRTGLTEFIQRECRVVIAGPTTLWAILNSLQMGFRTLAIQKRSSEVWNLLAAVKTEWTKYGDMLDQVQKKLNQASETIDKAKVRSRAVGRKLGGVQELPSGEAAALLPSDVAEEEEEGIERDETR